MAGVKVSGSGAYDVVVAGGGAGGVGAALGAARVGARVLLVEKHGFLGGAATNAQVLAYCGFFQQGNNPVPSVGGAGSIVLDTYGRLGGEPRPCLNRNTGNWIIFLDPEILKLALDKVLEVHGIEVLLQTRVVGAVRKGERLVQLTVVGIDGLQSIEGTAFVDASGDADLSRLAGVSCRQGDFNGRIMAATGPMRIGGLDPALEINREEIAAALKKYAEEGGNFPPIRNGVGNYGRLPHSGDLCWEIIDVELTELTKRSITRAEQFVRAAAREYVEALRAHVSGFERAFLAQTGPQIGIRESYHPQAMIEITAADLRGGRRLNDGVARASWPMEDHRIPGQPTYQSIGGDGFAHVPLDALRAAGVSNLWLAGRTIGADPEAYASIRVMGTCFATGEAAGVGAHLSDNTPNDVSQVLKSLGAIV